MTAKKKTPKARKAKLAYDPPTPQQLDLAKWLVGNTGNVRAGRKVFAAADEILIASMKREPINPDRAHARTIARTHSLTFGSSRDY